MKENLVAWTRFTGSKRLVYLLLFFTCLGTSEHSCFGLRLGTSLVANRHVFCGLRSHTSSGTSVTTSLVLSWHSSGPSCVVHPAPQISKGIFSQEVSPTYLPTIQKSFSSLKRGWFCYSEHIPYISNILRNPCILKPRKRFRHFPLEDLFVELHEKSKIIYINHLQNKSLDIKSPDLPFGFCM